MTLLALLARCARGGAAARAQALEQVSQVCHGKELRAIGQSGDSCSHAILLLRFGRLHQTRALLSTALRGLATKAAPAAAAAPKASEPQLVGHGEPICAVMMSREH
eukprot:1123972-Pelagomonas_calceolata.AAC.6